MNNNEISANCTFSLESLKLWFTFTLDVVCATAALFTCIACVLMKGQIERELIVFSL